MDVAVILLSFAVGWYFRGRHDAKRVDELEIQPAKNLTTEPPEHPSTQDRLNNSMYLSNSQWQHLYGLCEGILADDVVTEAEAKRLRKWFRDNPDGQKDARSKQLHSLTDIFLADGVLDKEEANELLTILSEFCDQWAAPEPKQSPTQTILSTRPGCVSKPKPAIAPKPIKPERPKLDWTDLLGLIGCDIEISYMGANGDISDRTVSCKDIDNNGEHTYIKGYCKSRRAYRTFRLDRIITLINTETGEFIET